MAHCITCNGTGTIKGNPEGAIIANLHICPDCWAKGKCPACGKYGWTEWQHNADNLTSSPCFWCGWNHELVGKYFGEVVRAEYEDWTPSANACINLPLINSEDVLRDPEMYADLNMLLFAVALKRQGVFFVTIMSHDAGDDGQRDMQVTLHIQHANGSGIRLPRETFYANFA